MTESFCSCCSCTFLFDHNIVAFIAEALTNTFSHNHEILVELNRMVPIPHLSITTDFLNPAVLLSTKVGLEKTVLELRMDALMLSFIVPRRLTLHGFVF